MSAKFHQRNIFATRMQLPGAGSSAEETKGAKDTFAGAPITAANGADATAISGANMDVQHRGGTIVELPAG